MSLPSILFGRGVVTTSRSSIEKVQRIENKVWRYLLGIGGYSSVEALRGEIGASMIKSRMIETVLLFLVDTMNGEFSNVKTMMTDTLEKGRGKWYNTVDEYRQELQMTWRELRGIYRKTLKEKVKEYDTWKWREGLMKKTNLRIYSLEKKRDRV